METLRDREISCTMLISIEKATIFKHSWMCFDWTAVEKAAEKSRDTFGSCCAKIDAEKNAVFFNHTSFNEIY